MKTLLKFLSLAAGAMLVMPVSHAAEHKLLFAGYPSAAHPGYLGVGLRDVTDERLATLKLKDARGVEVIALDHDGPAAKVGIREHDVILQINSQEIASDEQLRRILRETPAGRKADLVLSRDGQEMKVEVVLGDRSNVEHVMTVVPDFNFAPVNVGNMANLGDFEFDTAGDAGEANERVMEMSFGSQDIAGAQVETVGPQLAKYFGVKGDSGLLVKNVRPETAASKAGLKAGDVVVKAAGNAVASRAEWDRVLRSNRGKAMPIVVLRDKHEQKLTLTVAARTQGFVSPAGFDFGALPEIDGELLASLKAKLDSAEFQEQEKDALILSDQAVKEFDQTDAATQAAIASAQAEAKKAAQQWTKQQPEVEKQLRDAMEQLRLQTQTMD